MKNYLLAFLGAYKMNEEHPEEHLELADAVRAAKQEWYAAQSYFENVSEPELVDYAIYRLEAAKKKYIYLLKLARKEGLRDNRILEEKKQATQS
ncbi:MAG TPA: DUF2508 family protein [Clostridiales bacterium]|nr:DUF2508 family protein [Clostridiales bacterium]